MGMWSLLGEGMVPLLMVGQTTPPVYCHKGDDSHSSNLWKEWSGKIVELRVDNMAVVHVVNATFCSDNHLMYLIRLLVFFASYHNFWFYVSHIEGEHNTLADTLSCNNLHCFFLPGLTGTIHTSSGPPAITDNHPSECHLDIHSLGQAFYH